MRHALLIYNPVAGRYPSWLLTERAARVLRKDGWEIEIKTTQDGDHITRLAEQAAAEHLDALFVAGETDQLTGLSAACSARRQPWESCRLARPMFGPRSLAYRA